mmetsp:Transcript_41540/g.125895  ORF Transcript_41540/g.125895 Transcript_41540/m.125895 type:complete len:264 (+) Transcript_41540:931-1722(+)
MVNTFFEDLHQPGEQQRVHSQVETDSLVHELVIAYFRNRIKEEVIFKGGSTIHHNLHGIVTLLVSHVEVHSRRVEPCTFACTNYLANIELAEEHLAMFHDLLRNMFGVKNGQFSEDTNMGILKPNTLLKEGHEVWKVSKIRVVSDNLVNMIRILNDLQTTSRCKAEFPSTQTSKANMLPRGHVVRFGCSCHSLTVLLKMDVTQSKLGVVVDVCKEDLGRVVQAFGEASITNVLDVRHIRSIHKLFQLSKIICLGKSIDDFGVQ